MTKNTTSINEVAAIKANDENVLRYVYEANYAGVERFILNNSGTIAHAKDIYQEAFIALWRDIQLDKFRPENSDALAAYLFRIAKYKWLNYLRSNHHKRTKRISDAATELADELLPAADERYLTDVKMQFQQLGDNCREVLMRFYYKKESMKTIAAQFEWTEATAKNNKYRCLQKLRELINQTLHT